MRQKFWCLILCVMAVFLLFSCAQEPSSGDGGKESTSPADRVLNDTAPDADTDTITDTDTDIEMDDLSEEGTPGQVRPACEQHTPWKLNAVLPTCTREGRSEGSVCAVCGEILLAQESIPALGHDTIVDPAVALGCVVDARTEGAHCGRCGVILVAQQVTPSVGHRCEGGICTVCGEVPTPSEGLAFTKLENGTYAVSGIGTFTGAHLIVPTKTPGGEPVTEVFYRAFPYENSLRSIHLPEGIVAIGHEAFEGCGRLQHIDLPTTLKKIGGRTFQRCPRLTAISLPDGLEELGYGAFNECTALREMVLPQGLRSLEILTFAECSALEKVHLPASLQYLGGNAFLNCAALQQITVDENNPFFHSINNCIVGTKDKKLYHLGVNGTIPDDGRVTGVVFGALSSDFITEVVFPESVTDFEGSFSGNSGLVRVVLPSGLRSIGDNMFYQCTSLQEVVIPSGLRTIGEWAFWGCTSLKQITLPDSLVEIGDYAFRGCTALEEIIFPAGVELPGKGVFRGCTSLKSVIFKEGALRVGEEMFYDCTALVNVALPDTLYGILKDGFRNCSALPYVELPDALQRILVGAFNDCTALTEINIPRLGEYDRMIFNGCTALERVTFGEGTTIIQTGMFAGCKALRYVYLPASLKEIGDSVFSASKLLETVEYAGTQEQWQKIKIGIYNEPLRAAECVCLASE